MNCHLISGVSRKAALIGVVAAALFAFAVPFSVAPAASASPSLRYTVSLSCTTSTQTEVIGGLLQSSFVSFTPGSPVSLTMAFSAVSPCKYQTNLPKATVDAAFTLRS